MNTMFRLLLLIAPLWCGSSLVIAADEHDHHHADEHADTREAHDDDHDHDHDEHDEHHDDHGHDEDHAHGDEHHESHVTIAPEMAAAAGIRTAIADSGKLEIHIPLYGRLVTPPHLKANLRARFPGVITAVNVNVGDTVNPGDVLALIESNESLQTYQLRAPIEGVVQSRTANVGEVTGDAPLFELNDTRQLWAEFKVFPGQRDSLSVGKTIHISHGDHHHSSPVLSIAPAPQEQPYVIARAAVPNPDQHAIAGDLVKGALVVETLNAPLLVENRALQTLEDQTVVFVLSGETYEARPLTLGRTDGRYTEVLMGLRRGDHYVAENSYLIKADLEKSAAAHDH